MRKALKQVTKVELLKLDLGCGKNKLAGYHGVDSIKFEGVDSVVNLAEHDPVHPFSFKPWPWKDESVEVVHCSHFIEHLSAMERTHFFNELYRVLIKDGKATLVTPYWKSGRAYGDLTHQWPPVVELFWHYLDKNWRAANAPHSELDCDFACTWGYSLAHPWGLRSQEVQVFALNHYTEVAQDMICTAVKRGDMVKQ